MAYPALENFQRLSGVFHGGPPVHPQAVSAGKQVQACDAMNGCPAKLGQLLQVDEFRADKILIHTIGKRVLEQGISVVGDVAFRNSAVFWRKRLARSEKHEAEGTWMIQCKPYIAQPKRMQTLTGMGVFRKPGEFLRQMEKIMVTQRLDEGLLVRKMLVNDGRGITNALCYGT